MMPPDKFFVNDLSKPWTYGTFVIVLPSFILFLVSQIG